MWATLRQQEEVEVLTIGELFDWAQENDCVDLPIRYTDGGKWALFSGVEDIFYPAYLDTPVVALEGFTI